VEDVAFRVLAAGNQPDFRTISDFRKIHHKALEGLFQQVLRLAMKAGAIKMGRVALDGSKVKANASKHKAMSYGRMKQEERALKKEVQRLLAQAEAADYEEDARYGKDKSGDELPEELSRRETRLQRIREAKRALEQEAREEADKEDSKEVKPEDKTQYNFSDPESRIMKGSDGFVQAFNTQVAVESISQLIVGQTVTQEANDKQQIVPMVTIIEQQAGQKPKELLADSGYCSEKNLEYLEKKKITAYVAINRKKHREPEMSCKRGPLPNGSTRVDRMKRKLQTKTGAKVYAARKSIVEPVFGQIKHARGFRQFLMRGIEKVKAEWALVCATHNILKLYHMCYG
jgi:hypothetical protein